MNVLLYPFFSQQDKRTGRFLSSDSGVKLYTYIARRLAEDGHSATLVAPHPSQREGEFVGLHAPVQPVDNLDRRLAWDPWWLRVCARYDLVLTQHETIGYPLKALGAKRVVSEVGMKLPTAWPATDELIALSRRASDALHCNSEELREGVTHERKWLWQFSYDFDDFKLPPAQNTIDVLFNSRCSATSYTNHELFLAAVFGSGWTVLVTDPTSYLRRNGHPMVHTEVLPRDAYVAALQRSSVVVGLADNGYGGHAFVEAIAAGACPVALQCYRDILTEDWPYFCDPEISSVHSTIAAALRYRWKAARPEVVDEVRRRVALRSYSAAYYFAKRDLEALL